MKFCLTVAMLASLGGCADLAGNQRGSDATVRGGQVQPFGQIGPSGKPVQIAQPDTGFGYDPWPNPVAEAQGGGDELAFITTILSRLNRQSFVQNTEICGYVGRDPAGTLFTTENATGREAECYLPTPPANMTLLASYHTHGTYSPEYDSEFPTSTDMESDRAAGIDGYIATPGGRLWFVDSDTMTVRELCGVGCLPMDPGYRPDEAGRISISYTYAGLQQHER